VYTNDASLAWETTISEKSRMVRLHDLELSALEALLATWGGTRADAQEVWHWLYQRGATAFDQMTTLPQTLRERLAAETTLYVPPVLARQEAPDGETRKDLLQLEDGEQIEVVLLRYRERRSACVSTQVGCACGCTFCATGQQGFVRQLSSEEILAQVLHLQRELAAVQGQLSNVVLMGMGEPLLNTEPTLAATRRLVNPRALGFVQRRITLSTVGIVPGIERLVDEDLQINLAVSLHAATDTLRDRLVPINQRYPLDDLFAAMRLYTTQARRRIMIEWVMIDGVNDTPEQAQALAERLAGIPAHVNLIRLNPTPDYDGQPSPPAAIDAFVAVLDHHRVPHTMRQRRGGAIAAGCGQLRSRARSAGQEPTSGTQLAESGGWG
jgi:23S rRNA (adenine2503-C2)-methyltransferase